METIITATRNTMQWSLSELPYDFDFADIALLSDTENGILDKLNTLEGRSHKLHLKIHEEETKIVRINHTNDNPIFNYFTRGI